MNKYLLEIGTEELPYRFIKPAQAQLETAFVKMLNNNNITFESIKTYGTPRRLSVIIEGLAEKQPDIKKEVKGPIVSVGLDANKNYTNAATGFAKKNGISVENLIEKDNYLWANIEQKGALTSEILQKNIENIVLSMQGPYFMRWANLDVKFQRPIRWVVSLLNDKELPIKIADITSSKYTRGHRNTSDKVEINKIDEYENILYQYKVVLDSEKRKQIIIESAKKTAQNIGAEVVLEEDLLDEVTYLTEWPVPILCEFDKKYLDIPEKVIVTVMSAHQRYFPVYKNGKLLNNFITMANYIFDAFDNIKAGNERVITARLDDAIFFFKEDTKKPLSSYVEALKGMTFQKGMGTMFDKTQRIVKLSKFLGEKLNLETTNIERAAFLAKADLATSLVFEFTELQGFIGCDYAEISKELPVVAQAIKEHYFPLNSNSETAKSQEGQIIAIADKIDTVVAVFADGKKPTGSQDPLGVRRNVLGILKTILTNNLSINLTELIDKSIELMPIEIKDNNALKDSLIDFFEQRLMIYYADKYPQDVLQASISGYQVLNNLKQFITRVENLISIKENKNFNSVHESANRILRILKNTQPTGNVKETLLIEESEKALFNSLQQGLNKQLSSFELMIAINPQITTFFENVLVMDKDENIKQNRINLLHIIKHNFEEIADFSKINVV